MQFLLILLHDSGDEINASGCIALHTWLTLRDQALEERAVSLEL